MKRLLTILTLLFILSAYGCTHTIYFDKKPIDNNTEDTTDKENNSDDSSSSEDNKNDDIIVIPNNEIWYTSTDGKIVEPYDSTGFGANIISNTYENGKGIITFDGNVTTIGVWAFRSRENIVSLTMPNTVTSIKNDAVSGCVNMTDVYIGQSVVSIGDQAFSFNDNLKKITIPSRVTDIGIGVFRYCENLSTFEGKFASDDGRCLIVNNSLMAIAPKDIQTLNNGSYTLPSGITTIENYAICSCRDLNKLTLPIGLTTIKADAFEACRITTIEIPYSVTTIEERAFYSANNFEYFEGKYTSSDKKCVVVNGLLIALAQSGLTQYITPNDITTLGILFCSHTRDLTKFTISDSVVAIREDAFYDSRGITELTIGRNVQTIAGRAFCGCESIKSVTIPKSTSFIGNKAFWYCDALKEVYVESAVPPSIPVNVDPSQSNTWSAFDNNAASRKIYVPRASVDAYKAADGWKEYADAIEPYDFPETGGSNTEIPNNEIWYTSTDGKIVVPSQATAFNTKIASITYTDGKGVITFDEDVIQVGTSAFSSCNTLSSITLPNSVTKIGSDAFFGCSSLISLTIPNSVTEIGIYAFCNCDGLTNVTIPNSVTVIGTDAFHDCDGLTSITIPNSVTEIGINPFRYCDNLAEFKGEFASKDGRCLIIDGILNSFAQADLSSYTIPDNVTKIGDFAFSYCSDLTSITISDSVTEIGNSAFCDCHGLTSITIPINVSLIEQYTFASCKNLSHVYCKPNTPPIIEENVFTFFTNGVYEKLNCKIYVPRASVDAYKAADGWKGYADAIEPYDF